MLYAGLTSSSLEMRAGQLQIGVVAALRCLNSVITCRLFLNACLCYSCAESVGHSIQDILDSPSSEAKPLTSAPSSQKVRNLF